MLDLASDILGSGRASRLYRAVRERQLAASVNAYNYTPTDLGVFVVHADMPAASVGQPSAAIWDQVASCASRGSPPRRCTRAQRVFESRWLRHLESMEGQATHLAEWEALGDWQLGDRYYEHITSATAAAITALSSAISHQTGRDGWCIVPRRLRRSPTMPRRQGRCSTAQRPAPLPAPGVVAEPSPRPRARVSISSERREPFASIGMARTFRCSSGGGPARRLTHVGFYLLGGAATEPAALAGLSTLLVRTRSRGRNGGPRRRSPRSRSCLGAVIGTSATADGVAWTISVPARRAPAAIDLLARRCPAANVPRGRVRDRADRRAGERRAAARRHVPPSGASCDAGGVRRPSVRAFSARDRRDVRRDRCGGRSGLALGPGVARAGGDRGRWGWRSGRPCRTLGPRVRRARGRDARVVPSTALADGNGGARGVARQGADRAGGCLRRACTA